MSHHDDQAALEAPRDALQRDLEAATQREQALVGTNADRARIDEELARVEAKLERKRGVKLPLLEAIQVASPCNASWADMVGDERVRFCGSCAKNVYNLSAMPRGEAEALVREQEGSLCVRFYRRADGTMLTADCPVGVRKKRFRRVALVVAGAGAGIMAAAFSFRQPHQGYIPMRERSVCPADDAKVAADDMPVAVTHVMGGLVAPPAPSAAPSSEPAVLMGPYVPESGLISGAAAAPSSEPAVVMGHMSRHPPSVPPKVTSRPAPATPPRPRGWEDAAF